MFCPKPLSHTLIHRLKQSVNSINNKYFNIKQVKVGGEIHKIW